MKRKIRLLLIFSILSVLLYFVVSFGWFVLLPSEIDASAIGGELLTNYFHTGIGTEEEPFVITRPVHYYNLVHLYQKVSDYSENSYHFQLGYELDPNSDDLYVYNYDDNGNSITENPYSKTLNLACFSVDDPILPIGTHDKNFLGVFNGNGLIISNAVVSTLPDELDCDLGIFGYIGTGAYIHDVYFDNITIDLKNISNSSTVINQLSESQTHNKDVHILEDSSTVAYVGYLAGHIISNAQIEHVYINDVKMIGGGGISNQATSYFGYFGCIETPEGELVSSLDDELNQNVQKGVALDEVFSRLNNYKENSSDAPLLTYKKVYRQSGQEDYILDESSNNSFLENDTSSAAGSFSFSKESEIAIGNNTIYLTGKKAFNQDVDVIEVISHNDGFLLKNNQGNLYVTLSENNDSIITTSDESEASVFALDNQGRLFVSFVDTANHAEAVYYYLSDSAETLITTNVCDAISGWIYDTNTNQLYYGEGSDRTYLVFEGSTLGGNAGGETENIIESEYNGTMYYVKVNGTTITTVTDKSQATRFEKDEQTGFWKVESGGNTSYISYASSELKVSSTQMTWNYINNRWVLNDQELYYDGSSTNTNHGKRWKLRAIDDTDFFFFATKTGVTTNYFLDIGGVISGTQDREVTYLSSSGNKNTVTIPQNAKMFTVASANVTKKYTLSVVFGGETYYLAAKKSGIVSSGSYYKGEVFFTKSTNPSNGSILWERSGNNYWLMTKDQISQTRNFYLSFSYGGTLGYQIFSTTSTSSPNTGGLIYRTLPLNDGSGQGSGNENILSKTAGTIFRTLNQDYLTTVSSSTTEEIYHPIDTWFPLLTNNDNLPESNNFGYVISGLDYDNAANDYYSSGDIRINKANISSISGSYLNNEFTTIRTFNASGMTDNLNYFPKYISSKEDFLGLINNHQGNIYSLRFMDSTIRSDDVVNVSSVSINDTEYTDFDLPRHCLYLNLTEEGDLSFFAKPNASNNSGFVSLHHITRDNNVITSIRVISKIYKVNNTLHYVYEGESPSYNSNDLVFDAEWLKDKNLSSYGNSLFYFEIPLNIGEYCLGSVNGNNGADILYIDVSKGITDLVQSTELTKAGLIVDFRSSPYNNLSTNYVDYSLFQFQIVAPGVPAEDFDIRVEFVTENLHSDYSKGLYNVYITNSTSNDIEFIAFLLDDNEIRSDVYLYAYRIIYNDQVLMNDSIDYFKRCDRFIIPSN